jgi:hypothetical protein
VKQSHFDVNRVYPARFFGDDRPVGAGVQYELVSPAVNGYRKQDDTVILAELDRDRKCFLGWLISNLCLSRSIEQRKHQPQQWRVDSPKSHIFLPTLWASKKPTYPGQYSRDCQR